MFFLWKKGFKVTTKTRKGDRNGDWSRLHLQATIVKLDREGILILVHTLWKGKPTPASHLEVLNPPNSDLARLYYFPVVKILSRCCETSCLTSGLRWRFSQLEFLLDSSSKLLLAVKRVSNRLKNFAGVQFCDLLSVVVRMKVKEIDATANMAWSPGKLNFLVSVCSLGLSLMLISLSFIRPGCSDHDCGRDVGAAARRQF